MRVLPMRGKAFVNRCSWDLRTRLTEGEHMVSHLKDSRATQEKGQREGPGAGPDCRAGCCVT